MEWYHWAAGSLIFIISIATTVSAYLSWESYHQDFMPYNIKISNATPRQLFNVGLKAFFWPIWIIMILSNVTIAVITNKRKAERIEIREKELEELAKMAEEQKKEIPYGGSKPFIEPFKD